MADESKNLLSQLTESRLPALPESQQPEPTEAPERTEVIEQGRTPEEVVQPREERQESQEPETPAEVQIPAAPKKKGKAEAKTYEIDGKRYTLAELEASGMLEKQIQTARQFEPLQQKYFKQLEEKNGAAAPAKQEQQAQPPAEITNLMIAQTYDPVAKIIVDDLVEKKLLEEDLVETWPRSMQTFTGQQRFAFDKIFELETKLNHAIARLEGTITYLNANKAQTEGSVVAANYNKHLDGLVAKDPKLYAGLKDQAVRDQFTKYLVEELHANIEQTTDDKKAPGFLAKQWVAFNSQVIMDAAKDSTADKQSKVNKRFVVGEGSGTRPGAPAEEPDLLSRLTNNSGRIRE